MSKKVATGLIKQKIKSRKGVIVYPRCMFDEMI
jgi:hypothetical protein